MKVGNNNMEGRQRKFGAVLSYVSIIVSTLVQLLYTPLLIRMLGQSEYGLYSLISSIIGYLTILDLGFGNAIIVYTAKYRAQGKAAEEKKLHGMFFIVFCIIGLIAGLLGLILYFNVNNIFGNTLTNAEIEKAKIMMLILSFNLAITFPFTIYSSIISAYERFTFQKIMSILNTILKPLLMIPLLFLGYKSIAMTIVITIINLMVLLSNYLYCKNKLNIQIRYYGFDKNIFKVIFSYSFFIFLGVIVDKVNWSVDQFVLGAVSGTVAVSLYSIASQINTLYMNISSCCCQVMLPKLSKMVSKNASNEALNREFIKFGRLQWYLMSLVLTGFIILGERFMIIYAGPSFKTSYYITLLLIIPIAFVLVENIGVYITQAKNLHKAKAIIAILSSVFNILLSIPLAQKYGGIGSALGTSISLVICNLIINNIYYYKKVKLNIINFWKNIVIISIPLVPVFIIGLIVNMKFVKVSIMIDIGIFAVVYSIVFFIVAYAISFNKYEKNIVLSITRKLKKMVMKK